MDSKQWVLRVKKSVFIFLNIMNWKSVGAALLNSKCLGDKMIKGINLKRVN
ncbi:hypothetical protein PDK11_22020 [Bacillus cereus]|nr:hypothetical protein [Bacillus cereus]